MTDFMSILVLGDTPLPQPGIPINPTTLLREHLTPRQYADWVSQRRATVRGFNVRSRDDASLIRVYPLRGNYASVIHETGRSFNIYPLDGCGIWHMPDALAYSYALFIPQIVCLEDFSCNQRATAFDLLPLRRYRDYGGEI